MQQRVTKALPKTPDSTAPSVIARIGDGDIAAHSWCSNDPNSLGDVLTVHCDRPSHSARVWLGYSAPMDDLNDRPKVPTVSRICGDTLIELAYDPEARTTEFIIGRPDGWRRASAFDTATGETLLPYAPANNLIAHECVMLPSGPVDYGGKDELLRDLEAYLHRYVDLSPLFERIAAHYILLTWVHDAFNELPYLRLKGDYGSGKTRALIALGSVAYKGFFASGASTVSPIFHTLDSFGGTLVLDEADLRFSDKTADLIKILNNGTVRGLPVLRTLTNRHKEFNPAAFSVYGPKIIAMRGTFRDQALESRFLTEQMGVRPLRSDIPIQLPAGLKSDALNLRNRLLDFRLRNLSSISSNSERVIAGIDPRLNQTALSLLSLVDDFNLREDIAAMLREQHRTLSAARAKSTESRVIGALRKVFTNGDGSSVSLREIAQVANAEEDELDEPLSPRDAGRVLRTLGVPLHKSHGDIVVPSSARANTEIAAKRLDVGRN